MMRRDKNKFEQGPTVVKKVTPEQLKAINKILGGKPTLRESLVYWIAESIVWLIVYLIAIGVVYKFNIRFELVIGVLAAAWVRGAFDIFDS